MSINTLSEENKEFITSLYGLKAGLSLISVEADKIRKAKKQYKKSEKEFEDINQRLQLQSRIIKKTEKNEENHRKTYEENRVATKNRIGCGIALVIFCLIAVALIPLILIISMVTANDMKFIPLWVCVAAILWAFVIGIYNFIRAAQISNKKELRHRMDVAADDVHIAKRDYISIKSEADIIEARHNKCKLNYSITTEMSGQKGIEMHYALVDLYSNILDVKYWRGIDYIIYVCETGKASDLNSALNLFDEEKRNDNARKACEYAAMINSNVLNEMSRDFEMQLSMHIAEIGRRIKSCNIKADDTDDKLVFSDSNVDINREIQNALFAKSHVSSYMLVDDMRYIADCATLKGGKYVT